MTSPHRAVGSKHCGCAPPSLSQAATVTAHYDGVRFSRCVQVMLSGCKFSTEKRNLQICRNHNFPTSTPLRVQKKSHFSYFSFLISHFEFTGACACYIIYIYLNLLYIYIYPPFSPLKTIVPPRRCGHVPNRQIFVWDEYARIRLFVQERCKRLLNTA